MINKKEKGNNFNLSVFDTFLKTGVGGIVGWLLYVYKNKIYNIIITIIVIAFDLLLNSINLIINIVYSYLIGTAIFMVFEHIPNLYLVLFEKNYRKLEENVKRYSKSIGTLKNLLLIISFEEHLETIKKQCSSVKKCDFDKLKGYGIKISILYLLIIVASILSILIGLKYECNLFILIIIYAIANLDCLIHVLMHLKAIILKSEGGRK